MFGVAQPFKALGIESLNVATRNPTDQGKSGLVSMCERFRKSSANESDYGQVTRGYYAEK